MPKTTTAKKIQPYPLISPEERLRVWEEARGMWKNRKSNPIQELKKVRKEWDRKLPPLR